MREPPPTSGDPGDGAGRTETGGDAPLFRPRCRQAIATSWTETASCRPAAGAAKPPTSSPGTGNVPLRTPVTRRCQCEAASMGALPCMAASASRGFMRTPSHRMMPGCDPASSRGAARQYRAHPCLGQSAKPYERAGIPLRPRVARQRPPATSRDGSRAYGSGAMQRTTARLRGRIVPGRSGHPRAHAAARGTAVRPRCRLLHHEWFGTGSPRMQPMRSAGAAGFMPGARYGHGIRVVRRRLVDRTATGRRGGIGARPLSTQRQCRGR